MYVCLYVCEPNVRVYDFVMLQYVKVTVCSVFWLWNFVWKALHRLDSCTHHFQPSNNIIISCLIKKIYYMGLYGQKNMWFQNRLLAGWSDHFGQKKNFLCRQFSVFSFLGHLHKLCVYTRSLRLQFACHEKLATLATLAPTVSWLRKVILTQLCRNLYKAERQWLSLSVLRKS